jgi:SPP1 gp7 family putative phage head morphogenesis protein
MAGIPDRIHNALIRESINLARYEAGLRARVLRLLETLGRDLVKELAAAGLDTPRTDWQRARLRELLKTAEQRASEVYGEVDALTRKELGGLVEVSADRVVMGVNKAIGADLLQNLNWTEEQLAALADENLIFGASSGTWWKRQAVDYAQGFADQMRMGQLRGEALGDLVKRVRGLQDISRRNAEALVRSSVISTANEAHLAAYRANADVVDGIEWVSTIDHRACLKCSALDSMAWDLDGKPIQGNTLPFPGPVAHWSCRCTQVAKTKTWEELTGVKGLDDIPPGQRASMGGPVSGDTTYQGWFDGLDADEQRDILGPGRYEAVKKRGLLLTDLVDQRGNELTLAELARK